MSIFDETKTITLDPEAIEIIKQSLEIYQDSLWSRGIPKEMMAVEMDYVQRILDRLSWWLFVYQPQEPFHSWFSFTKNVPKPLAFNQLIKQLINQFEKNNPHEYNYSNGIFGTYAHIECYVSPYIGEVMHMADAKETKNHSNYVRN